MALALYDIVRYVASGFTIFSAFTGCSNCSIYTDNSYWGFDWRHNGSGWNDVCPKKAYDEY